MITVVTGNKNKAKEVAAFFSGITEVTHIAFDCIEPQADSVEEIARAKAEQAYAALGVPLIVDDTGLFIDALSGFPGPFAAYVQDTIGNAGVLQLMESTEMRNAHFATAVAYADANGIRVFSGRVDGTITFAERGTEGFGYDPIFAVGEKTLAEMSMEEKNHLSHRARALAAFRDWYVTSR
ncbi:RdgB/HAM1 family non-canonical purine NTP pyrophosphatase [Methanocorpusculum sp. MG]|uniref:dITP/XTP pyrophosphatase n=1 Tax=Methanocorpusculum petauri TaxID=3002863 RepID=A0ABT4II44_9EURY|nr:RdgB/HAM1 family non-canonical purine NTP pyrophosphatase [Methanocorpusculum petauri]MDE2443832.1 RdgB/HAM1 family non-canonical purine NTP pyrophosphatase [Methanocorpusculum sp.]